MDSEQTKIRVLLVDDELDIIRLLGKRLEIEGFSVITATDGEDALRKAATGQMDIILLDLMLPKIDGYRVCEMIKKDSRYPRVPVVMLTARTQESDEKKGWDCGADAYIHKPFRSAELIGEIRRLLEKKPRIEAGTDKEG